MTTEFTNTGISVLGDIPWGTHFCQFYETKEDLLDILVPQFRSGPESSSYSTAGRAAVTLTAPPVVVRYEGLLSEV